MHVRTQHVRTRLLDHLFVNHLFNSFQFAHANFLSTKCTLLAILDYIINYVSYLKVTVLFLLDRSVAFDIIDPSILILYLE